MHNSPLLPFPSHYHYPLSRPSLPELVEVWGKLHEPLWPDLGAVSDVLLFGEDDVMVDHPLRRCPILGQHGGGVQGHRVVTTHGVVAPVVLQPRCNTEKKGTEVVSDKADGGGRMGVASQ